MSAPRQPDPPPRMSRDARQGTASRAARRYGAGRGEDPRLWQRVSGRAELERARAERFKPYGYESNRRNLMAAVGGLALWIILCLILISATRASGSLLDRWEKQGFTDTPPGALDLQLMVTFAQDHGFACNSARDIFEDRLDCDLVVQFSREWDSARTRDSLLFVGLFVLLIVLAFPFTWFAHRASRNLLPLKSEGQRFSPEWAVGSFFVPVMNLWRPLQVFIELFKASEPSRDQQSDPLAWRSNLPSLYVVAWWLSVLGALAFSPMVWGRVLPRSNLAELAASADTVAWTYLALAIPAVTATAMLYALHRKQEEKFGIVGPNVVTPPEPKLDAIEEELRAQGRGRSPGDRLR